MQFKRLRLQGFKSFVEPTDLIIGSGMTGIVGPNGCGKSNLVEALRWVMGETSPKRMRGSEMDDVIFAGTTTRPSRNVAEVQLHLDNADKTASAEFNDADDLAIVRQIERGSGSDYRVNGRPVRQRDIQLLFADQSTGAHSTSVVGQGQIDALIRAKPQERRQILEEASGTAGLQTRRHEAELKLRGAEQNLTRVDDIIRTQDAQLRSLKQQVRQASRYRNLAEHIRRTEAVLLHLRWKETESNAATCRASLAAAEASVLELTHIVTQETTDRTNAVADLPCLRQAEAAAAVVVQKLMLASERLDVERARVEAERSAVEKRLKEALDDRARNASRATDGSDSLARLALEDETLKVREADLAASMPQAQEIASVFAAEVAQLESALQALLEKTAMAEAEQRAILSKIASVSQRRAALMDRRAVLEKQRVELTAEIAAQPDLSLAYAMVEACETELAKRKEQVAEAEEARRSADAVQSEKRKAAEETRGALMRVDAEMQALSALLRQDKKNGNAEAIVDLISVEAGFEEALAVALGEALSATLDPQSARHWRDVSSQEKSVLPEGAEALSSYVKAPAALSACLDSIGLVVDEAAGKLLCASLTPGQILVSRNGWAWRWDGFTVTPDAKMATAVHLQHRNRLAALESERTKAAVALDLAMADLTNANETFTACQELDKDTRAALSKAFAALNDARDNHGRREREFNTAQAKLSSLDEAVARMATEMTEVSEAATALEAEQVALPNIEALRSEILTRREALVEARATLSAKQAARDGLARDLASVKTRREAISREKNDWQGRLQDASHQMSVLDERLAELLIGKESLAQKPEMLEKEKNAVLDELSHADSKRRGVSDALIVCEQCLEAIEQRLKQAENALGQAREQRVRSEGVLQTTEEHFTSLRERITEKLNCEPSEIFALTGLKEDEALPEIGATEETLSRYARERDGMGPVNLRAEVESETVQAEMTKLEKEKEDLTAAIAKLRQGISQLNREARERLQNAFASVNERFETLFKGLFNGGKAHLELIDDVDPMNAGLEIVAAPPGKKPQVLSLLSGGERTLTALALLFAVFQTNPSPICVLDEAEAALDESNIGRFCDLVETIARETGTRFLIITHQRLTMARMDRLFGVTMSEKGVSQLVSVDLSAAVAMREGAQDQESGVADVFAEVQAA